MSNYKTKVKIKATGEVKDVTAYDDYLGHHVYGYHDGEKVYREDQVKEVEEDAVEDFKTRLAKICKYSGINMCPGCGLTVERLDHLLDTRAEEVRREIVEEIKLWRPFFYEDKITKEDKEEIIKAINQKEL